MNRWWDETSGSAWERVLAPVPVILDKIEKRMQWGKVCESQIEIDLAVALTFKIGDLLEHHGLKLVPQYPWRRFRADFAILHDNIPVLFIECDGAEFHSSEDQLVRDRRKDAAALEEGVHLLRFSGSEIYRFADGCVERVLNYLVQGGSI